MIVYIFLLTCIIVARITIEDKKIFCIISGSLLYLLVALRSINIGLSDTSQTYLNNFNWIRASSLQDILNNTPSSSSIVFNLFTKFIQLFTSNYHIYIAVIGIPYILAVTYLIQKYSKYPLLSYMFFIAYYYLYSFFLVRQVLAMSFVIFSFKYLKEKKFIKFVSLILIASLFHSSAIFVLIAYPFCHFVKFGVKNYIFIFLAYVFATSLKGVIFRLISLYSPLTSSYIENGIYGTSDGVFTFSILINVLLITLGYIANKKVNYDDNILYNLATLGSIVLCFTPIVTEFYRLSLYFNVFNVILISNDMINLKDSEILKDKRIKGLIYVVFLSFLVFYFFTKSINNMNANPYFFYWSDLIS